VRQPTALGPLWSFRGLPRRKRTPKFRLCVQFGRVHAETELFGQKRVTKFRNCVQFTQVYAIAEL
jgi:hypothetical protein